VDDALEFENMAQGVLSQFEYDEAIENFSIRMGSN